MKYKRPKIINFSSGSKSNKCFEGSDATGTLAGTCIDGENTAEYACSVGPLHGIVSDCISGDHRDEECWSGVAPYICCAGSSADINPDSCIDGSIAVGCDQGSIN